MWPAANVLFVANLPLAKHDTAFITSAFGSRIGDMSAPLLILVSLTTFGLSWRGSILVILVSIVTAFVISIGTKPQQLKEPDARDSFSWEGMRQKAARLAVDFDGWLALISNLGTHAVWGIYDYAAVLSADTYHLTPGEAAGAQVYLSLGSAVGLAVAFVSSSYGGTAFGRGVHVIQSAISVVALCSLSAAHVSLLSAHMLFFMVGFGFVAIAYVPFMVYAARSRSDERAFRCAMLDGICQLCTIGFSYMYGTLRAEQGQQGVSKIFAIAAGWMAIATLALALFYTRVHQQEHQESLVLGRVRKAAAEVSNP